MIAPDLTIPEAVLVLVGVGVHPVVVTAGALSELELRGRIRCSEPEASEEAPETRSSRFRLDVLDGSSTGEDLLDATLTKARGLIEYGSHLVGADAMNRRLQSVHLRDGYLERLRAGGWFEESGGRSSFLRRRPKGPTAAERLAAMRQRLYPAVLEGAPLEPVDRALIAIIAVAEGADTLGRPLWQLLVKDPRVSAKAREREATRQRALAFATELVAVNPIAQAVEVTLSNRRAGMDTAG